MVAYTWHTGCMRVAVLLSGMAGVSIIDAHPLRKQLLDMLLKGRKHEEVAKVAGCSRQCVTKYVKTNIKPVIGGAQANDSNVRLKQMIESSPGGVVEKRQSIEREAFLSRLRKHEGTMDRAIEEAAASKEFGGLASIASARKGHLELEAKIGGLLNEAPVSTINITVLQPGITPQEQAIEADWSPV